MKRMETSWKKSGENNFAPENLVARWWGTFFLGKHIIGSATYKTVNQLMRSWSRSQCDNEPSKTFKIGNVSYCKVQSMVVVRRFASIHIQRMKYFCLVLVSLCFWTKKNANTTLHPARFPNTPCFTVAEWPAKTSFGEERAQNRDKNRTSRTIKWANVN